MVWCPLQRVGVQPDEPSGFRGAVAIQVRSVLLKTEAVSGRSEKGSLEVLHFAIKQRESFHQ